MRPGRQGCSGGASQACRLPGVWRKGCPARSLGLRALEGKGEGCTLAFPPPPLCNLLSPLQAAVDGPSDKKEE